LPPGEGTILSYTRIPASRGRVSRVYQRAARPCVASHAVHMPAQVPLDGRLCQALSGTASGSIVLTVLRPTGSVDKLLRASTELMRSRRQQGAGAASDSALSGAGSSRHLASALSGAGSSAAVVPAAGGEHRVDVGGGGDDGDALACTTALTAAAGTRTGTGSGGCESRTLAPPRQSSPSIAPAKDLQPSRQSRTTCTTTTTTGASSPRLGSPELRASPTASPRGAGLLAEQVDELSWRAERLAC